jgi:hypothetical protein
MAFPVTTIGDKLYRTCFSPLDTFNLINLLLNVTRTEPAWLIDTKKNSHRRDPSGWQLLLKLSHPLNHFWHDYKSSATDVQQFKMHVQSALDYANDRMVRDYRFMCTTRIEELHCVVALRPIKS